MDICCGLFKIMSQLEWMLLIIINYCHYFFYHLDLILLTHREIFIFEIMILTFFKHAEQVYCRYNASNDRNMSNFMTSLFMW